MAVVRSDEQLKAWLVCAFVYVAATAFAVVAAYATRESLGPLWSYFVGDAVGTLVVFATSVAYNNSSLYDPYWSVAPMVIGLALLIEAPSAANPRLAIAVLLTWAWGARLTWNFLRGWTTLSHEDWRYRDLRRQTKGAYWLVSFLGIHFFPTVLVFLGLLALFAMSFDAAGPLTVLDGLGMAVAAGAIVIEATADAQLATFRRTNTDPKRILNTGLWAWCRHPNYFGEMMFWWGLSLMALGASYDNYWVLAGPVSITALFNFISVRLIDERMIRRRPHYAEHRKKVRGLLPLPPRRTS